MKGGSRPAARWRAYVASLPLRGREIDIEADEAERRAIAAAHGLVEVASFRARVRLVPTAGEGVRLTGRLGADIRQTCVVSLRPVDQRVDVEFTRLFAPPGRFGPDPSASRRAEREVVVELDEEEGPEPFDGIAIDLEQVLLEEFALALDPYPRHPDAAAEMPQPAPGEERETGAFAALEALRTRERDAGK